MVEKRSYTGNRENGVLSELGPAHDGRRHDAQTDKRAMGQALKAQAAMRFWNAEIAKLAAAFESRWTLMNLKKVDERLAGLLHRQRNLFAEACVRGTDKQIVIQGQGTCNGFAAAIAVMERQGITDDAYLVGQCPDTGTMIAIGVQAAQERVREVYGDRVAFFTADELAALCGRVEALRTVAEVKRKFPGAVVNAKSPAPEPPGGAFDYPPD